MKKPKTPARRLREERRRVGENELKEPLRRRLLVALGNGPRTSSALAKDVGARKESVSRKLGELRNDGLVAVAKNADDRRQSSYSLTRSGRSELGRHLTFGAPEKPPAPPDRQEDVEFLWEALGGARRMRRRSNRLGEAIDRFTEIEAQAKEIGADDLALEALAELIITQRQDRQLDEREKSLQVLKRMAMGAADVAPQLVYPAIAHLEYERGKAGDIGSADTAALARHLTAASSLFEALIKERTDAESRTWSSRRAWSVVSLANNLREQSRYRDSLRYAASGLQMFDELDDAYGRAQCWLLFGFCLRLLHQFDAAWSCLDYAHTLATSPGNSFDRVVAYCLVQMGEVRRCQGKTDEARGLLEAAYARAEELDLYVAKAFANSAIAATEFQDEELERAQMTLRDAQITFDQCKHQEGIALNARRQATVARHLSAGGVSPDESEIKKLIRRAEQTYRDLGSPAGVAACEVERGWMRVYSPSCGDVAEVEDRLIEILSNPGERESVILDPWVPGVLIDFGKQAGGELGELCKVVKAQASARLLEQGEEGVQSVSEVAGELENTGEGKPSTRVVEMGGESRRKRSPLQLAAV